jgi:hypothetical protein
MFGAFQHQCQFRVSVVISGVEYYPFPKTWPPC